MAFIVGGNTARDLNNELNEIEYAIGTISRLITITSRLRFDPPQTDAQNNSGGSSGSGSSGSGSSGNPTTNFQSNKDGFSGTAFLGGGGMDPSAQQARGSLANTTQGGVSVGGGIRVGSGGVNTGFSSAGSQTIKDGRYDGSGGFTAFGQSANVKLSVGSGVPGGISLSGGIQRATVGQGIVGPYVGDGR
jgi:hypothetical protein